MKKEKGTKRGPHRWCWLPVFLMVVVMAGCGGGSSSDDGDAQNNTPAGLARPTGVKATPGESSVTLTWQGVKGASHYSVYWSAVAEPEPSDLVEVSGVIGTTWVHPRPGRGVAFYYVVVAKDSTRSSEPSGVVSTRVEKLKAPAHVLATEGVGEITLSWDRVPGATGYLVRWTDKAGAYLKDLNEVRVGDQTSWTHRDVVRNTLLYYDVVAVDGDDESAPSQEASASSELGLFKAPGRVRATAGNGCVALSWDAVPDKMSYTVAWSATRDQNGLTSPTEIRDVTVESQKVEGLENATTYYFTVRAEDDGWGGEACVPVSAVPLDGLQEPVVAHGMVFRKLSPGTFMMGSPDTEPNRKDNEDLHEVALTKGFYLMTTEVTQKQWQDVLGENPSWCQTSHNSPAGDFLGMPIPAITYPADSSAYPVENVFLSGRWVEQEEAPGETKFEPGIKEFIDKLNAESTEYTFRLPTEAEWEYAARAGTSTPYAIGDGYEITAADARFRDSIENWPGTCKAISFSPNSWGFYNMHGNVNEWVADAWRDNLGGTRQVDPFCATYLKDGLHCVRGGGYTYSTKKIRSAFRQEMGKTDKNPCTGFRLAADKKEK